MEGDSFDQHVAAPVGEVLLEVPGAAVPEEIVLTEMPSSSPDSSVAQVTSTLFAPMPPANRRSAPEPRLAGPGRPGLAHSALAQFLGQGRAR